MEEHDLYEFGEGYLIGNCITDPGFAEVLEDTLIHKWFGFNGQASVFKGLID